MSTSFTVYGGNGHHPLKTLPTMEAARAYAAEFERKCWRAEVEVPKCIIKKEEQK